MEQDTHFWQDVEKTARERAENMTTCVVDTASTRKQQGGTSFSKKARNKEDSTRREDRPTRTTRTLHARTQQSREYDTRADQGGRTMHGGKSMTSESGAPMFYRYAANNTVHKASRGCEHRRTCSGVSRRDPTRRPGEPAGRSAARTYWKSRTCPPCAAASASLKICRADLFGAGSRSRDADEAGGVGDCKSVTGP